MAESNIASGDITKVELDGKLLPEDGTLDWILNDDAIITVYFKNIGTAAGIFTISTIIKDELGTVLYDEEISTGEIPSDGIEYYIEFPTTYTPIKEGTKHITASLEIFSFDPIVHAFRTQCLTDTGEVTCSREVMHDNWLITKKLADKWWLLERSERDIVADYVIRNWGITTHRYMRDGKPDCAGGEGEWSRAVCLHNAFIRLLLFANGADFYSEINHCYYTPDSKPIVNEYCYWQGEDFGLPVYLCGITRPGFGHAICAFQLDTDMVDFNNWQFFQYTNPNIIPGDWQMPCGSEEHLTNVRIEKIISMCITCSGCGINIITKWKIDKDCAPIILTQKMMNKKNTEKKIIEELQKMPELCIAAWSESSDEVILYVSEYTTQNLALRDKVIDGKNIFVYISVEEK